VKRFTLIVVPGVMLVLLGSLFAVSWADLPDPIAVHWGINGEPDGSFPRFIAVGFFAVIMGAVWVAVYRSVRRTPADGPSFTAGLFGISALLLAVAWLTISANQGKSDWTAADEVGLPDLLVALLVAVVAGAIGWLAGGGRGAEPEVDPVTLPRVNIDTPESAVWSGRGIGKLTTAIGIAIVGAGLLIWGWSGIGLALVGIVVVLFSAVRVTVSGERLVVSLGWWGYPSWRVPLSSVARAQVERVNPMAYGGWGYRVRPGVRAVVVRAGDAVRIVREDGADLVYTVDDAERGAGLINSILGVGAK
jgi:hypothetical protein